MIMRNERKERRNHALVKAAQDNRKNIRPSLEQECTNLYCQLCRPEL
jgi:hypothetical protein